MFRYASFPLHANFSEMKSVRFNTQPDFNFFQQKVGETYDGEMYANRYMARTNREKDTVYVSHYVKQEVIIVI